MLKKGSENSRCAGAFQTAQLELSSLSQDDTRGDLATHLFSNLVEIGPRTLSSIEFPHSAHKGETLQGNTSQILSFRLRKKRKREEKLHKDRSEITEDDFPSVSEEEVKNDGGFHPGKKGKQVGDFTELD